MIDNIFSYSASLFVILIPLISALCIIKIDEKNLQLNIKLVSIWSSGFVFALTTGLLLFFDDHEAIYYYEYFSLNINRISIYFMEVTAFITLMCTIIAKNEIDHDVKKFNIMVMVLESSMLMLFSITNILLYSCLLEIIVLAAYFLVGFFSTKRKYPSKDLIILFSGVIFVILGTVYIISVTGVREIYVLSKYSLSFNQELIFFVMFFMGLYCISGLFPLHLWTADSYPTSVFILLLGAISLIGGFGMINILIPIAKNVYLQVHDYISHIVLISVIYFTLSASAQRDYQRILAHISTANISVSLMGLFSCHAEGIVGAIYNMMTNSVTITSLLVINDKGLLCSPSLAKISIIPLLTILSMPLLPLFYGEFLIIYSMLRENLVFGILLCAILMPGMFFAVKTFCEQCNIGIEKKISGYDFFYLIPPVVFIVALGISVTCCSTNALWKYVSRITGGA
ncbi:NADH dehydrogenase subunit M [Alphaproteobacteria bacterium]|nr:NADH dehydrogenase subunit M [Alphaproteobacteria bacterium]